LAEDAVNFYVMAVIDWHKTLSFVVGWSLFAVRSSLFALRFSLFAFRSSLFARTAGIPTEDFSPSGGICGWYFAKGG